MKIKDTSIINPKSSLLPSVINYIDTSSVYQGTLYSTQQLIGDLPSRAQRLLQLNDILISSVRPNLEHNYFVNTNSNNLVGSTGFIHIRVVSIDVNPKYLFYYLTLPAKISLYSSIAESSQTTFPAFSKEVIEEMTFPDVSRYEQDYIVDTINFSSIFL